MANQQPYCKHDLLTVFDMARVFPDKTEKIPYQWRVFDKPMEVELTQGRSVLDQDKCHVTVNVKDISGEYFDPFHVKPSLEAYEITTGMYAKLNHPTDGFQEVSDKFPTLAMLQFSYADWSKQGRILQGKVHLRLTLQLDGANCTSHKKKQALLDEIINVNRWGDIISQRFPTAPFDEIHLQLLCWKTEEPRIAKLAAFELLRILDESNFPEVQELAEKNDVPVDVLQEIDSFKKACRRRRLAAAPPSAAIYF